MLTDPIADMLIRIKNACLAKKNQAVLPYSKIKEKIAKIFLSQGYLNQVKKESLKNKQGEVLICDLKYEKNSSVIRNIQRVSKPGMRVYLSWKKLPRPSFGMGISIISTSKGLMTNAEAIKKRLGGEVVCKIW